MNNLQIFNNPEFGDIRTVTIDGEPWFVGKDVAVALGYKDTKNALKAHVYEEDKRGWQITTPSGEQQMTIINESGLYTLIFGSKLESAKRFKHWVTSEVLPAIRKTGHYEVQPSPTLKASSISEVVNMAKFIKDLMKMQGATPYQVADAVVDVTKQIGFDLSDKLLLPVKLEKVREDELDLVDFACAYPQSSYRDYILYRTLIKMAR